ncbi:hypothetical protein C7293_30010 [filamentous cyanobacterium CCT1]|nr:hypothetical protein C7293_30010 [filamentous cyanobacterium CCT1]PSN75947.1 hypothetical protein C8B47_29890 [filamentous cyanobacterium CCP4]
MVNFRFLRSLIQKSDRIILQVLRRLIYFLFVGCRAIFFCLWLITLFFWSTFFMILLMAVMAIIPNLAVKGIHSALWIGEVVQLNCQPSGNNKIDCTLTYQAIRRSWSQLVQDVQEASLVAEPRSENDETPSNYVLKLSTNHGNFPVKGYANLNSELEIWQHQVNSYILNPSHVLEISVRPKIRQRSLGFFTLITYSALLLIYLVFLIYMLRIFVASNGNILSSIKDD